MQEQMHLLQTKSTKQVWRSTKQIWRSTKQISFKHLTILIVTFFNNSDANTHASEMSGQNKLKLLFLSNL